MRRLVPLATTLSVSVAVGPATGVWALVTPEVMFTYVATVPDRTRVVITQEEFAAIEPPVSVSEGAPAAAVSVLVIPHVFEVTGGVTLTRVTNGVA